MQNLGGLRRCIISNVKMVRTTYHSLSRRRDPFAQRHRGREQKDTIAVGIDATVASYKIEMKEILMPEFLSLKGFSPGHPRQS